VIGTLANGQPDSIGGVRGVVEDAKLPRAQTAFVGRAQINSSTRADTPSQRVGNAMEMAMYIGGGALLIIVLLIIFVL
jgi:hypothetical protein